MKTINLRWIYPHYRHDEFVEVSDEVWEAMRQAQREMNNYERRKSTTAPGTLWTHIAGRRTTRWNTADRRRKSFWSVRNGPSACG